jgi:uncharacterized protein
MADHGLTQAHLAIIRDILVGAGISPDRVALFGSRATGRARPNSDIDLYGPVAEATVDQLHRRFEDSFLPVSVDLLVYDRIDDAPLKAHIDRVARSVFTLSAIGQGRDHGDISPHPI